MSPCYPFRPIPGQCGPHKRGPSPAPPFNPQDYWATRKLVSSLFGSLETTKLDKVDVVDPSTATEDGKAAEAKSTYKELTRISGVASDALVLAESKADKLSSQQLVAVNSGIDADKVSKILQNESAISTEVSRATTEEARLQALINAIKTFEAVVADSLPSPSEQYSKKLYLIPSTNPETKNVKDEFICVLFNGTWGWEQVGTTAITIEYDDEPTEGSQKAVRSGGIWSAIWGTLAALPAGFTSIYDWCAAKIKLIEESLAGLDKYKLDANKGLNFAPSKYSEYNAVEIVNGWWLAVIGGFGNIWDVSSDGLMRQSLSSALNGKADKAATSVANNLASLTADGNLADSGKTVDDFLPRVSNEPVYSTFDIHSPLFMDMDGYIRLGVEGFIYGPFDQIREDSESLISLRTELDSKADRSMISATNTTFSSAVLAVGLNIDTNSVAVLNEIAATFGGFPIGGTATTVGGLLAALAAAIAWLKKNKVQTLKLNDNSVETSADGGVAKLDGFFTDSNSLLNGRLSYSRNATGLKDRAFNTISFDGTEFNLSTALEAVTPTASGQPRDLLIVATATAATTISFTAGTIKGDKPTIDGSGTWLITLTEYAANTWYCRQIKMEDAA